MTLPTVQLLQGDCREVLRTLADNSVDAIVTDPPYGLSKEPDMAEVLRHWLAGDDYQHKGAGFMGKTWDSFVPGPAVWRECLRVLKPGGHMLAFFGTRTYDMGVLAIRLAGFEVRDQIGWIYGSGFPKSLDVSKAIAGGSDEPIHDHNGDQLWCEQCGEAPGTVDMTHALYCRGCAAREWQGWGTAFKPAQEPIVVARKPLVGTVAANVLQHGTGALNIDGCRVEGVKGVPASPRRAEQGAAYGDLSKDPGTGSGWDANVGRWPANIIHDGSDEVLAAFPEAKGQQGDLCGHSKDRLSKGIFGDMKSARDAIARVETETSAARFFYCAKASRADRNAGLQSGDAPAVAAGATMGDRERADWQARNGNYHPTVKPTELMRYLCRLITPPGGTVLDIFMGSGSTGRGAVLEGFDFIGIERDLDDAGESLGYLDIARARIGAALREVSAAAAQAAAEAAAPKAPVNLDLFAELEA